MKRWKHWNSNLNCSSLFLFQPLQSLCFHIQEFQPGACSLSDMDDQGPAGSMRFSIAERQLKLFKNALVSLGKIGGDLLVEALTGRVGCWASSAACLRDQRVLRPGRPP